MTKTLHHLAGRVIVVGSGLAGLVTALVLAPKPVLLLTRAGLGAESSSGWAQGGIAASIGADDGADLHIADTLAAGDGLCDTDAATAILSDAPAAIALLESFGVRFDRMPDGTFMRGLEAAHSRRRVVHVGGDGAGAAIIRALIAKVRNTPSITVLEGMEARRLTVENGRIAGLVCATGNGGCGERTIILPSARIVLATGGLGGLYDATTNPAGNYGQGIALAARAGAELADMEFVQFHPTAIDSSRYPLGQPLPLVSEAVRGEGAILINEKGERFMAGQPAAELAPRDIVARAISTEIARGGRVFLDARQAPGEQFSKHFPIIDAMCRKAGINPASDPIPVRPAVHYHMGGVATDLAGRSSVEGLWVVGEAASTGLHGANRLASNSLLEAAVMGMRAADDIAGMTNGNLPAPPMIDHPMIELPPAADISAIRPIVSRHLGVLRSSAGLEEAAIQLLPHVERGAASADPALVALAITVFATLRQESRGAHARTDFPQTLAAARRRRMTLDAILDAARTIDADHLARHPAKKSA